jgi:hypothetical protein
VGPYHLLIGFGNEPTYAGEQNSVFLLLTNAKTGAPIVDEGLGGGTSRSAAAPPPRR